MGALVLDLAYQVMGAHLEAACMAAVACTDRHMALPTVVVCMDQEAEWDTGEGMEGMVVATAAMAVDMAG
tara:strand:+ start:687 stop:896 length:210 start_codon:yes stop_codon:yes gene_type:complete